MARDEQARYRLHLRLDEVVGPEETGTLMEPLPPPDVATRQDLAQGLDSLGHRVDAQIADLRTEVRTGLADLRTELRTEVASLRGGLAEVRAELHEGLGGLGSEIAAGQRLLLFGMLTAMFTLTGLVWAAVTLGA